MPIRRSWRSSVRAGTESDGMAGPAGAGVVGCCWPYAGRPVREAGRRSCRFASGSVHESVRIASPDPASRGRAMQPTDLVDHENLRDDVPDFGAGDTLKVHVRVVEGNRQRVQLFEGVVIKRQGSGVRETFTVRKLSFGVGVERTFPVHSPIIDHIEVLSRGDVRRAKLYYLRDRIGKRAKVKEKREF